MIKAVSSEVTCINTVVSVDDEQGKVIDVVRFSCNLDTSTFSINEQCTVLNKDLYLANAADIKAQYAAFRTNVTTRATSLGYILF